RRTTTVTAARATATDAPTITFTNRKPSTKTTPHTTMISTTVAPTQDATGYAPPHRGHPTVWGLTPVQLHDRFWAARGVQVVRPGEDAEPVHHAELFLLSDTEALAIFRLGRLVETLSWVKPDLLWIRLHDGRDHGYRE